jgi:hypothetical protein
MSFSNGRASIRWLLACVAAAAAVGATGAAWAAPSGDAAGQAAVWSAKEFTFQYQGFTTRYSCDGLRDKMRSLLLKLGARDDLEMTPYGCTRLTGPDSLTGLRIKMSVLQPAAPGTAQSVAASWKRVDLLAPRAPLDAAADCELIAQIQQQVLPLFATRNVDYRADCRRGQVVIGSTRAQADTLAPGGGPAVTSAAR